MEIDRGRWSGEGLFTQTLLETLGDASQLQSVRVEDAPATRSDADYNFISNEIFVRFDVQEHHEPMRRFGFLPATRRVTRPAMTLEQLADWLALRDDVGPADYTDDGMLQYLRTERVIPAYQTRGYKLVELVRIYEMQS